MQEPFEPPPKPQAAEDELATMPEPPAGPRLPEAGAPMREVAHAFRLNAEALHTLKEVQADLARQVRRGDRSELVVQSTQALNETFRNLTSVQQELLRRIHAGEARRGGGPLIPLMLLGLLIVFLGCTWVVLDQLDRRGAGEPSALSASEIVRRERDAWREGRNEGAAHADNELRRLGDALDEAKGRARTLQSEIDARAARIAEIDQARRAAELERDDFAGQVRKAQGEMMAKQVLEDEVGALELQLEAANRAAARAKQDLDEQRRRNAWLRERMADYGMGFDADDPPWRPGEDAGAVPEGMPDIRPKPADEGYSKLTNVELIQRAREKLAGTPPATTGSASDSASETAPVAPRPGAAAYGGDRAGMPPPTVLRDRGGTAAAAPRAGTSGADTTSAGRVQRHLNGLLRGSDTVGGAGWRITALQQVAPDRLQGVVMVRYDAGGRMVETVEAREVRIRHDRERKQVEFAFRDGARMISGQRLDLPPVGSRVVVAEGRGAEPWNGSSLEVIERR